MDNGLLHQEPLATVASVGEYYFGGEKGTKCDTMSHEKEQNPAGRDGTM